MNKNLLKRTVNFRGTKAGLPGPASLSLGRFHLQLPTSEDLEFGFRRKKAILLVYRVFSGERDRSLSLVIKGTRNSEESVFTRVRGLCINKEETDWGGNKGTGIDVWQQNEGESSLPKKGLVGQRKPQ